MSDVPQHTYEALLALKAMMDTPGWRVICDAADESLKALTEQMHDLKTPPDKAEGMRQARGRIIQDFMPQEIAASLIRKFQAPLKNGNKDLPRHPSSIG